jgi:hypothetical protein
MLEHGEVLFRQFTQHGFEGLVDDQPRVLASWLRERAAQTDRAHLVFISDAITAANTLFISHDEYGGIRHGFIRRLDEVVYKRLPVIQKAESHWAAKLAKDFCDEILVMVRDYDPQEEYG